jgi:hypothetical protein
MKKLSLHTTVLIQMNIYKYFIQIVWIQYTHTHTHTHTQLQFVCSNFHES